VQYIERPIIASSVETNGSYPDCRIMRLYCSTFVNPVCWLPLQVGFSLY